MILLDSDHLSVLLDKRDARSESLWTRLDEVDNVALPIITVEEQLRGWLALIRRVNDPHRQIVPYLHLKHAFVHLCRWPVVEWNEPAADNFKRLRSARVRIGSQDLKIASIALANEALLLSANLRDFQQVPELHVEDWLQQ